MREEIAAAVVFLKRLIKLNANLTDEQLQKFCDHVSSILVEKFKNHWHANEPSKGQAFRSIRTHDTGDVSPDPVLLRAAQKAGLSYSDLSLPAEVTLWVDPQEVSVRMGEFKGPSCTVATFKEDGSGSNKASTLDISSMLEEHRERRSNDFRRFQQATANRSTLGREIKSYVKMQNGVENATKFNTKAWISPNSSPQGSPKAQRQKNGVSKFTHAAKSDKYHWVRNTGGSTGNMVKA